MSDIATLRAHLFATLTALQDKDNPMDIERAKAVCQVGDVIISSAKAEIDFARVNGSVDTQFFHKPPALGVSRELPIQEPTKESVQESVQKKRQTETGVVTVQGNVTTHRIR